MTNQSESEKGRDEAEDTRGVNERKQCSRVPAGFWECSGCGCQVIDEPGNFCSFCASYNGP